VAEVVNVAVWPTSIVWLAGGTMLIVTIAITPVTEVVLVP
jgi:hypothetical protein